MSFNTKFLIQQGRKKLNIQDSSLPKINQKINNISHNNNAINQVNFSKNDLQQIIEIYCKDAYDRKIDDKQFVLSKVCKLPFLKKAIRRKGETLMISVLNQMTLEYYSSGQELYNNNQGNKQNFYILLSGSVGIQVQNEQFFIEEKEEELKRAQVLKDKQNQLNDSNNVGNSNKIFSIEVKQMGQAMIKRKTDGYVDKQREKENQQIGNRSQLKSQNDSKISQINNQAIDNNNSSQIYLPQHFQDGDLSNKKNQKEAITKERIRELNAIQENLAKRNAREFKEVRVIQALATLGEKNTIQGDNNQEIQKIIVKSGQAIVLMLKGETFKQFFNDLIESEEKISKIAFFLSIPLFSNFKMREVNQILSKTKIQTYKKQQIVYNENDLAEDLYIVKRGEFTIYKEIILKNPLMPDLFNKKTVKNIEICSITEGQYFGLDELLECTLLESQVQQEQEKDQGSNHIIKRVNSVKCLTAESELFVIPYDSFKKYINPEMINIDSDSLQQQAEMRNEILVKKKQQQERQELKMIAMKRNIKSECSKYHQIQDEINTQAKEKQQTFYQKSLNDSRSVLLFPQLDVHNTSIEARNIRKQPSFYTKSQLTDPDQYHKNNSLDCFLTKIPDNNIPNSSVKQNVKYPNLLDKLPNKIGKNISDPQNLSSFNDVDLLKDNIQQFNKNISIYNENMQKYIRAVSEFSEKIQSEPQQFRSSNKQNDKTLDKSQEVKTEASSNSREQNRMINQLNYVLTTNPQQTRGKRSLTSNSNYYDRSTPMIEASSYEYNSIQQLSPKHLKIKLHKVESMEEVKTSNHSGVRKVDRLFNYLNEIENKQHFGSQNSTIINQDVSLNNISVNYQSLPHQTHPKIQLQQKFKNSNEKQNLQAISSNQQNRDDKAYIEDIDEIENHLNKKDIMIQILNNKSNHINLSIKKQNPKQASYNNQSAQGDVSSNNQISFNQPEINKSDSNINQYTTFGDSNPSKGYSFNSLDKRNNTQQGTIEKLSLNNPAYKKQKNQIKQIVQSQTKIQSQLEQVQIEQLLDEINENYSKVPIKPFIVSPSCAVKNTKRMIKKSRRGMSYMMAYPIEYYGEQQLPTEFNIQPDQQQQDSYNYNLHYQKKKNNQKES